MGAWPTFPLTDCGVAAQKPAGSGLAMDSGARSLAWIGLHCPRIPAALKPRKESPTCAPRWPVVYLRAGGRMPPAKPDINTDAHKTNTILTKTGPSPQYNGKYDKGIAERALLMGIKRREINTLVTNLRWLLDDLVETSSKRDAEKICANIAIVAELLRRTASDASPLSLPERLKIARDQRS